MNRPSWTSRIPASQIPAGGESHRADMALAHSDPAWTQGSLGREGESDVKEKTQVTEKTELEAPRLVPTQAT